MLISGQGHIKLTDFGLSRITIHRGKIELLFFKQTIYLIFYYVIADLEITDLINSSPNVPTRTPGQLLSLTSHFSFVSNRTNDF